MPQSIQSLLHSHDGLEERIMSAPVGEVAEELERLDNADRVVAFRLLPRDRALAVFEAMDVAIQQAILESIRDERFRQILEDLDPDDRARLLGELPAKVAKRALLGLSPSERRYTAALLGYPEDSAGRVMTPEFISLRASMTVEQALAKIRPSSSEVETLFVLPVTDEERQLLGRVDLPTLVRAEPGQRVGDLMTAQVETVRADEDQEVAARLIADRSLAVLPVLDSEDRLVGVVTADDAMRILEEEGTEDLVRAGGSEPLGRPYLNASAFQLAARRATWLLVLGVGATLTVNVMGYFEDTLATYVVLALFIPLLIDTGGNTGAQAATVVIRAMSLGEVRFSDLPKVVFREARVGVLLGAMLALVAFAPVAFFFGPPMAWTVSLTLVAVCTWATFAGATLPMVAERIGIDPAVVSAPFITTLVDATGLIVYFVIARAILGI